MHFPMKGTTSVITIINNIIAKTLDESAIITFLFLKLIFENSLSFMKLLLIATLFSSMFFSSVVSFSIFSLSLIAVSSSAFAAS